MRRLTYYATVLVTGHTALTTDSIVTAYATLAASALLFIRALRPL